MPLKNFDIVIVGSGLAGLYSALLASRYGNVLVLTKAQLEDSNTYHAQGGIAVALGPTDSTDLHLADTIAAGAGLGDPTAIRVLVENGRQAVADLIELGVPFDREHGEVVFTTEAAHSRARVVHSGGDATGKNVELSLAEVVRQNPKITIRERCEARALLVRNGRVVGVRAFERETNTLQEFEAAAVVLATGGAGQLFSQTTNPDVATGDGIALAFRAGAAVSDLEFFQFHPTALAVPGAPRFLISEAVRGEGGILRNGSGERFAQRYDPRGELAPRDVVARAIFFETQQRGEPCAYLDVSHLGAEFFRRRFPTIAEACSRYGIDIAREPIPVAPAAHYLMGGIRTDSWGETSLAGLYAVGECACTGVHGANRLASNSLLEGLAFATRFVHRQFEDGPNGHGLSEAPNTAHTSFEADVHLAIDSGQPGEAPPLTRERLRDLTWTCAGLTRERDGLAKLEAISSAWQFSTNKQDDGDEEGRNLVLLARLLATSALLREESRGAHYRTDFPQSAPAWQRRIVLHAKDGDREKSR
ncbi:MAG TPA: L-aspartate oxidase [Chloroflexota bacterium]|nr:L-aspartate oxidase [Chloroflexota bacterium]